METVEDIIREMREVAKAYFADGNESARVYEMLSSYADRLDAAYKRDLQSIVDAGEIDMRTAMDEVARLRKENAELTHARELWFRRSDELRKRCDELYNGGEA